MLRSGTASVSEPAGEPQRGGTINYSYNTEPQSVDPATCAIGIGLAPCQAVFGALMYYDIESGEFEPGMAESLTTEDGQTWMLELRPNMTFTDGTPFDADAVAFNWQRILDPALLSSSAVTAKSISWEVIDPQTVKITADKVNHQLPLSFTEDLAFIGSPTAIAAKGPDFGNSPVGAGPFTLTSWSRGSEMVLDRNPNYWDQPRPYVDRVVMKTIAADDQRFNALQAGELDIMAVTLQKYADRAEAAGLKVTAANLMGVVVFALPTAAPWPTKMFVMQWASSSTTNRLLLPSIRANLWQRRSRRRTARSTIPRPPGPNATSREPKSSSTATEHAMVARTSF